MGIVIGTVRRLTVLGAVSTVACLAGWLALASPASAAFSFSSPVDLGAGFYPQPALDGAGHALVVYQGGTSNSLILGAFGPASGPLTGIGNVSAEGVYADEEQVAFDSAGNALCVWRSSTGGQNPSVKSSFRTAGGGFDTPVTLSSASQGANPQVAFGGDGSAVAAWVGTDDNVQSAFRPAGGAFGAPVTLSTSGSGNLPQVAMDDAGDAVVVWVESDGAFPTPNTVVRSAFRPAGGAFASPVDISAAGQNAGGPQVAFDAAGNALAVWTRANSGGAQDTVQSSFRPAGGAFAAATNVSASGFQVATPQVGFDPSGNALAVWSRSTNGIDRVVAQASFRPAGGVFGSAVDLSGAGQSGFDPQVAFDGSGDAVAVWTRYKADANDVVQAAYRPAGGAFAPAVDLSDGAQNAEKPQVAVDGDGRAVVTWYRFSGSSTVVQAAFGSYSSGIPPFPVFPVYKPSPSGGGRAPGSGSASGGDVALGAIGSAPGGTIAITVSARAAGAVTAVATTTLSAKLQAAIAKARKPKTIRYGKSTKAVVAPGKVTLRIKPGATARRALKKAGKLRVAIKLTFIPRGGGKRTTVRRRLTVARRPSRRR